MYYMITITQVGAEYQVRFPYNPTLVEFVKSVPGRRWHPEHKMWTVPSDKVGFLLNLLHDSTYSDEVKIYSTERINENATIDPTRVIPDIDVSKVKYYTKPGTNPFSHQLDFMRYAIDRQQRGNMSGFILADEMGCIAGDAKIDIQLSNGVYLQTTLAEAYNQWIVKDGGIIWMTYSVTDTSGEEILIIPNYIENILHKGIKPIVLLTLENDIQLKMTPDHEVFTGTTYIPVSEVTSGDPVLTCIDGVLRTLRVESVEPFGESDVYDIVMSDPLHNFVVNGLVVHNCGKTNEVCNLAIYNKTKLKYKHCLIICCVNSAKYSWYDDIVSHTDGKYTPYLLGSRVGKNGNIVMHSGNKEKLEDLVSFKMYGDPRGKSLPYFLILNIEALRYKVGKKYPIADALIEHINNGDISLIALDEIHKNTSPTSMQGKQILRIKQNTGANAMWIPMTGTPITKKPTDVFLPLKLIDGHTFKSFYTWCQNFCIYGGYGNYNIIGYKNIPTLKNLLQGNMLRRLKKDVLDLPPKIYYTEYIENTPTQERLYNIIAQDLYDHKDTIIHAVNPVSQFLRLRQVNDAPEIVDLDIKIDKSYLTKNAKIVRVLELLEEAAERDEKTVIFCNWSEPLKTLYKFVSQKYNTVMYTGEMSEDARNQSKETFINDSTCTVMLGTVGALGTNHTLTVATNVIFYNEPWNPSDKVQCEDRLHRAGTKQPVNVFTLITKGTVDERVHSILYRKEGISNFIVDNLDIRNNPDLFDLLLRDTVKSKPARK